MDNRELIAEPGGGDQEEFEFVLKGYYDTICRGNKPTFGRNKGANKKLTQSSFTAVKCAQKNNTDGAALLAVCRGKVNMILFLKIDIDRTYC